MHDVAPAPQFPTIERARYALGAVASMQVSFWTRGQAPGGSARPFPIASAVAAAFAGAMVSAGWVLAAHDSMRVSTCATENDSDASVDAVPAADEAALAPAAPASALAATDLELCYQGCNERLREDLGTCRGNNGRGGQCAAAQNAKHRACREWCTTHVGP